MEKNKQKKTTIDDLAAMTQRGFTDVEHRLGERMDRGFHLLESGLQVLAKQMTEGFQHVNARLDIIRDDVSDLPAMREELHDLRHRLERVEQKVGLGK